MSEGMFEWAEVDDACGRCGRPLTGGECHWCAPTPARRLARRDGPQTSKDAAVKVAYRTGTQKAVILAVYEKHPAGLTDEEVAGFLGEVEVNKVRKRCSDLRNDNVIAPTGATRKSKTSGMDGLVCAIVDSGIATRPPSKEPDDTDGSSTGPVPATARSTVERATRRDVGYRDLAYGNPE